MLDLCEDVNTMIRMQVECRVLLNPAMPSFTFFGQNFIVNLNVPGDQGHAQLVPGFSDQDSSQDCRRPHSTAPGDFATKLNWKLTLNPKQSEDRGEISVIESSLMTLIRRDTKAAIIGIFSQVI